MRPWAEVISYNAREHYPEHAGHREIGKLLGADEGYHVEVTVLAALFDGAPLETFSLAMCDPFRGRLGDRQTQACRSVDAFRDLEECGRFPGFGFAPGCEGFQPTRSAPIEIVDYPGRSLDAVAGPGSLADTSQRRSP
jgi:hypothetical protein